MKKLNYLTKHGVHGYYNYAHISWGGGGGGRARYLLYPVFMHALRLISP